MATNKVVKTTIRSCVNGLLTKVRENIEAGQTPKRQNKNENKDKGGHYRRSEKKTVAMVRICTEYARS